MKPSRWIVYIVGFCVIVSTITVLSLIGNKSHSNRPVQKTKTLTPINQVLAGIESKLSNYSYLQKNANPDLVNTYGIQMTGYAFRVQIPYNPLTAVSYTETGSTNGTAAYAGFIKLLPEVNMQFSNEGYDVSTSNQQGSVPGLLTIEYMIRTDSECQVTAYDMLDIYCDSKSDLQSIAKRAQPFVEAYESSYSPAGQISVYSPVVLASKMTGYVIASMAVTGNNGMTALNFYKHSDGPWNIVNLMWYNDPHENGSITPNCGDFDSLPATKQAFLGMPCYDSATRKNAIIGE
jgi:hypothetical protein